MKVREDTSWVAYGSSSHTFIHFGGSLINKAFPLSYISSHLFPFLPISSHLAIFFLAHFQHHFSLFLSHRFITTFKCKFCFSTEYWKVHRGVDTSSRMVVDFFRVDLLESCRVTRIFPVYVLMTRRVDSYTQSSSTCRHKQQFSTVFDSSGQTSLLKTPTSI